MPSFIRHSIKRIDSDIHIIRKNKKQIEIHYLLFYSLFIFFATRPPYSSGFSNTPLFFRPSTFATIGFGKRTWRKYSDSKTAG